MLSGSAHAVQSDTEAAPNPASAVQFSEACNVTVEEATQNPTPSGSAVVAQNIAAGPRVPRSVHFLLRLFKIHYSRNVSLKLS